MAQTEVIELDLKTNAGNVQQQFSQLRNAIKSTSDEVEELTREFGDNSDEVKQATKRLESLQEAYKDLGKSATDLGAKFEDVYGEMQPLTARMGEAEDRLYEMALAGQTASKEYQDLLAEVARYRKVQMQTDMVVDAASNTMANKMGGALQGVASGFSVAQGVMGTFGADAEALEPMLLKVQSAMAISEGINGLREGAKSFKAMGMAAKTALQGIKAGVAATGLGVLLVAMGTLYAYWDDIKAAVGGVSGEQEKLNKQAEANVALQQSKLDSISGQENILKLQGKSERDILNIKMKQTDEVIAATEQQIHQSEVTRDAQVAAAKRNQQITKFLIRGMMEGLTIILRMLVTPIDVAIATANKLAEVLGFSKITAFSFNEEISKMNEAVAESTSKFFFDPNEVAAEGNKVIKEQKQTLAKLKNDRAGLKLQLKAMDKQESDEKKKNAEEQKKILEEKLAKEADIQNQANQNRIRSQQELDAELEAIAEQNYLNSLSEQEREIRLVKDKYFELETLAAGNAEALAELEIAKLNEINDINLKYQQLEYDQTKEHNEKLAAENKKKAEDDLKAHQDKVDRIMEYASTFSDAMSSLNDVLNASDEQRLKNAEGNAQLEEAIKKRMFERDKKLRIVQTVIDTASNVINSVRNGGGIPTGIPFGIAAGAMGAMQIAAISKTKYEGGGGSSSMPDVSSSLSGGAMAPSFNVVGNSGVNQLAALQQQPVQAYVVSGQMTTAQELDRNRIKAATW